MKQERLYHLLDASDYFVCVYIFIYMDVNVYVHTYTDERFLPMSRPTHPYTYLRVGVFMSTFICTCKVVYRSIQKKITIGPSAHLLGFVQA